MHNWNTTSLLETDQNKQVLIALLSVYIQCNAIRLLISSNQLFAHPPPQLPDSHCESVVITTAQRRFVLPRDEVYVLSTALINVSGRDCVTFFSFLALMRPFAEEQRGHGGWVSFQTLQFFAPSAAAEQNVFHSCETGGLGLHLHLDVLLGLFQGRLHQVDHPPEAFLQAHAGGGRAGLDEPGPALTHCPQTQVHTQLLWALSLRKILFVGEDHQGNRSEALVLQDLMIRERKGNNYL